MGSCGPGGEVVGLGKAPHWEPSQPEDTEHQKNFKDLQLR